MEKVNIYLYSSIRGRTGNGIGIYILEAPDVTPTEKKSNILTQVIDVEGTKSKCQLLVMKSALKRFKRPSNLHIFVDDNLLLREVIEFLPRWNSNGWKTTMGTEVRNKELWQQVWELLKCHVYELEYSKDHKYYKWQQFEAERRMNGRTDKNGHRQSDSISKGTA